MTRLFRRELRTDSSPIRYTESRYEFLDRADSEFFGNVRQLVESWYASYPDDDGHLRAGFQSKDDRSHTAAFWELYLYTAYRATGRAVDVHPDLGTGSRSRPDFLVHGSTEFVVEARLLMTSAEAQSAGARTSPLFDAVNEIRSDDFFVWMSVVELGDSSPSLNKLKSTVREWLQSLDADSIIAAAAKGAALDSLPSKKWKDRDWEVELRAIPKKESARGKPSRLLGVTGGTEAQYIDNHSPFVRTLKSKSPTKYGEFKRPYVIAVLSESVTVDDSDVFSALFGREAFKVSTLPNGELDLAPFRHPDGYWHGPVGYHNKRVSGVLVAQKLFPWTIATSTPRLWLNPYPASPVPSRDYRPWATAVPDHHSGEMIKHPAPGALHELFELPPDWPGREDLTAI